MDQQQIGSFIRQCREAGGLTQQQLADKLGVTNKAVSKWETGKSMPDVALFEPLCRELGISLSELLAGRRVMAEERPAVAERLLAESISSKKLVGLQAFLMLNSVIGVLLALSPLLLPLEAPFSWIFTAAGLLECGAVIYFDLALPGKETRRNSYLASVVHATTLFALIAVLNYPAGSRAGVPLSTMLLTYLVPYLLSLLLGYFLLRARRGGK